MDDILWNCVLRWIIISLIEILAVKNLTGVTLITRHVIQFQFKEMKNKLIWDETYWRYHTTFETNLFKIFKESTFLAVFSANKNCTKTFTQLSILKWNTYWNLQNTSQYLKIVIYINGKIKINGV